MKGMTTAFGKKVKTEDGKADLTNTPRTYKHKTARV